MTDCCVIEITASPDVIEIVTQGAQGAQGGAAMKTLTKLLNATTLGDTDFVSFPDYGCTNVNIINATDYSIDIQLFGEGDYIKLPSLHVLDLGGFSNANEVAIRLSEGATNILSIGGEAYTLA